MKIQSEQMPRDDPQRRNPPRRRYLRMVVAAAVALVALAVFAVVAERTFLRHEFQISTLVDDSAGIAPSSPVQLNGIDVGHVVKVALSGSPDPDKTVRIVMQFPRSILADIPDDSTAAITSANLLGDKYIDISRGRSRTHVQPGAEIGSTPTQDISTLLSSTNAPLDEIDKVLAHFNKILGYIDNQQGTLGKLINNSSFQKHLSTVSGEQSQLLNRLNTGRGVLLRLNELSTEVDKPMARLSAIETEFERGGGSLGRFLNDSSQPTLADQARAAMNEANQLAADFNAGDRTTKVMDRIRQVGEDMNRIVARIDEGQGTLGRLLVDPELRDSFNRAQRLIDQLTAEIKKHPLRYIHLEFGLF